jgi:hypothetical protein
MRGVLRVRLNGPGNQFLILMELLGKFMISGVLIYALGGLLSTQAQTSIQKLG